LVERHQAAKRRAVVPGAEGEGRLDLDADPIWRNAVAVVRAVDHKPPGRNRCQPFEALGHPIALRDGGKHHAVARRTAGEIANERPHRILVGRPVREEISTVQAPERSSQAATAVPPASNASTRASKSRCAVLMSVTSRASTEV